ncbi:MAG: putative membrane-bound dehydrogenase-like protein [Saprospiraceae bacterium]|jgi:putative membrane-bound dehydrogenase-like protein
MKNIFTNSFYFIIIILVFAACGKEPAAPIPELTYYGEETRIQHPLSPEDSKAHFHLPKGFEAEVFASEPDIINPIQFTWDERGRLWVVQSQDYPHELENDVGGDRITICEDTDGDGKADKFTDFATEQSLSTGIVVVKGGVIVAQAPEMVFLEDTDGDDVMDKRTVLFDGFGTYDTHAGPSSLRYGPDNQIWGAVGYSGFESEFDGKTISFTRGVYRFDRDGKSFEPLGQFNNNTWGLGVSVEGEIFGSTANNNHACYVGIPLKHYSYLNSLPSWAMNADFIQGHYNITVPEDVAPLQQVDVRDGFTAAAGANFYTAENYPKEYRNQMLVTEPTGHVVHVAKIEKDGAGYKEVDGGNLLASTDAWTAPVFAETGPDGNVWVADWYNPVIQHNPDKRGMENQIWNNDRGRGNAHNNEHRDKRHGRIYVITYKGKKNQQISALNPSDGDGLIQGLKSTNMFWRTTAQRLIVENNTSNLIPDLMELAKGNLRSPTGMHALYTLDGLGAFDENDNGLALLESAMSKGSPSVKKAALNLIPNTSEGNEIFLNANLLSATNLQTRLAAALKATELPESDELYNAMEEFSNNQTNQEDKWLMAASNIYFRVKNFEKIDKEDVEMVVLSAEEKGASEWKYTSSAPEGNWNTEGYDDSKWESGMAGFGKLDRNKRLSTNLVEKEIWLRKEVTLEEGISDPVLKMYHDDLFEVYINGKLLYIDKSRASRYKYIRLQSEKGALFKKGKNVIAVYNRNERDNQQLDLGIGQPRKISVERQIVINTIPQIMEYEQKVVHAMAGEQLEIVFNNTDEMQHNLVLIEKGATDAFGKIVDKFLTNPKAAELEYLPKSRYIMGATKMVNPGESDAIQIKVPDVPGDYPFICTFPGHWRIMQGILKVSPRGSYAAVNPNAKKIAIMGGGGSHNFLKFFGVADGKVLNQQGKNEVNYTEKSSELTTLLKDTDILMLTNNREMEDATKEAIFSRVNQGMPMLIVHPSVWYNWKDWPEYNKELVAGGSTSHEKLQEFEVIVTKPNHPIMKGVPTKFKIVDELYRWKYDPTGPKIEVLAIGKGMESGEEFPVVWIVKHRIANIVGNTLGHDERAHSLPAYQSILENSLEWAMPK